MCHYVFVCACIHKGVFWLIQSKAEVSEVKGGVVEQGGGRQGKFAVNMLVSLGKK